MTMAIRRAQSDDDVAQVRELWNEYWAGLVLPDTFQGFGEQLRTLPGEFVLLLADDGTGTIAVRPLDERRCEVKRLYVRPGARGTGLGRGLLQAAIAYAVGAGFAEICCDTLPTMHEAARLYEVCGFARSGAYSADPTPGAIYFRLVL